jgi:hypothetical protein
MVTALPLMVSFPAIMPPLFESLALFGGHRLDTLPHRVAATAHFRAPGVTFFIRERIPFRAALIMSRSLAITHDLSFIVGHGISFGFQLAPLGFTLVGRHGVEVCAPILGAELLQFRQ